MQNVQASPLSIDPVLFRPLRDHLAWIALAVALAKNISMWIVERNATAQEPSPAGIEIHLPHIWLDL